MQSIVPLNKTPSKEYWSKLLSNADDIECLFKRENHSPAKLFEKFVCIVNIETSSFCNRACGYCPLSTFDRTDQKRMPSDIFSAIVSQLESINYSSTISLNLYNEPLADKEFFKKLGMLRNACPNAFIKFNSNGDYLNLNRLDRVVDLGANAIFVTLHPDENEAYDDDDRLKHFNRFFEKLDLDWQVEQFVPGLQITADVNYRGMRLLVESHNWQVKGNDRAGTVEGLAITDRNTPCVRPLREFSISYDGSVYPCCQFFSEDPFVHKYRVDTISGLESTQVRNIFDIYASQQMFSWIKSNFSFGKKSAPCSTCNDPDFSDQTSIVLRDEILTTYSEKENLISILNL